MAAIGQSGEDFNFEDKQDEQQKRINAFTAYWEKMGSAYRDSGMLDWWKEYLASEEFQDIRYQPQVLHLITEEFDHKILYGINDIKALFWDAYGFQEGEDASYQEDVQKLFRCLYPGYVKRQQDIQNEQKWAKRDKIIKIFIGAAAAVVLVICIMIPMIIHRQRENGRLFLIDYMAEKYPDAAFSQPERKEKTDTGGIVYTLRSSAYPELPITATVEYQYQEGEKAYLVTEDYGQLLFEYYAMQYGLEAGRVTYTEGAYINPETSEYSALFFTDPEELDDFCERAQKLFLEQEELQNISEVAICTDYVLYPAMLFQGGAADCPFADRQVFDLRTVDVSALSTMLQETYMAYMFQFEPWNISPAQYREWGAAYEKICEEWADENGEWHEVHDPDTGECLCRLFISTYQSHDGYYGSGGNMPSMPRVVRKITVGNAYYFLQDRGADLSVDGDGGGFTVTFYGREFDFGSEPEVEFGELRDCY